MNPLEWIDQYTVSPNLTIFTKEHLVVPGLNIIGRESRKKATDYLPDHVHENAFEFHYFLGGQVVLSVGDTDYKLTGGDVFFTKPGEVHSTNMVPVSVSDLYWFRIASNLERDLLFLNETATRDLTQTLMNLPERRIPMEGSDVHELIECAMANSVDPENALLSAQCFSLFIGKVIQNAKKAAFKLTPDIGRTMNYILDHITEDISLDTLASVAFLSTSQFKQKFKKQIGTSPRQFINSQKIEYAKPLLLDGCCIGQVAAALNFENSSYFTIVFKKFNHCTPSEYICHEKLKQI